MEKRVKMTRENRAKQFKPFDALKGLQEALRMKEYEYERRKKADVSEEELEKMTKIILNVKREDVVQIKYYEDGYYHLVEGKSKVDFIEKSIKIENKIIAFDDIKKIKII